MRRARIWIFLLTLTFSVVQPLPIFAEVPDETFAEETGPLRPFTPVICIDPGHQRYGNKELEPDGPDSAVYKPKVTSGTQGVVTRIPEHELNLEVALLLKKKLLDRGYEVVMTREEAEVDLSNKERADIANDAQAGLFVRIHADGDGNPRTHGISVLYPGANHPLAETIVEPSEKAARHVLDGLIEQTQAKSRGIVSRSDLSGFNWANVPGILVEMGFMSNPEEDKRMATEAYRELLAEGMAAGIDAFFQEQ